MFVSTLLLVEVAGAASRSRRDPAAGIAYAQTTRRLPSVRFIALDDGLAATALDLAARRALRGADAVYAAVAIAHACTLLSLDQEHLTRLVASVPAITPADAVALLTARP